VRVPGGVTGLTVLTGLPRPRAAGLPAGRRALAF
jgi:hypothetical protein